MKKIAVLALLVLSFSNPAPALHIASGASQVVAIQPAPTPTPTPSPTITPTATPTSTPTSTPTPQPTPTFIPQPYAFSIPLYGFTPSEIDAIRASLAALQSCRPDVFEFVKQNTYGIRSAPTTDAGANNKIVNLSIPQTLEFGQPIFYALVHEARHNGIGWDKCNEDCANALWLELRDCWR